MYNLSVRKHTHRSCEECHYVKTELKKINADYSSLLPQREAPTDVPVALKVGIVLPPNYTLMSMSCFVEFLRLASDEQDFSRQIYCSWSLLSHNYDPIISSCGFSTQPTALFDDPNADYDYIVVHGGILHSGRNIPDELYEYVERQHSQGKPIAGLCTGPFILAELGLMENRQCAVHFSLEKVMREQFPNVIPVTDEPVVQDGPFLTCPGGLSALNLAARLVRDHCGQTRVDKSLHYFMADPGSVERQTSVNALNDSGLNCVDRRVAKAVSLMHSQLYDCDNLTDIANTIGTSERELSRLFKKYLYKSPAEYWREIRLQAAHWMVLNSDRSMAQIAYECGFTDSSHLIRWFKRRYDETPNKLRNQRNNIGTL